MQLNGHGSVWTEIRSGVSQGSVLGPFFFLTIFIDDIDEEVLWAISKFVDDTKVDSQVNTLNNIISVKRTLDKLVAWANRCDMDISVNKCAVLHTAKRNLESQYQMNDSWSNQ